MSRLEKLVKMKKRIYLDNAATTPLDLSVEKAMSFFWVDQFGNPGGLYKEGRDARKVVDSSRVKIAELIGASSSEITFTSGGTESNNLAIFGVVGNPTKTDSTKKVHIITTKFEHESVLEPCRALEKRGIDVTYLKPSKSGLIDPKDVKNALRPETILITIMYANNEIGTVQSIAEIAGVINDFRRKNTLKFPYFHIDACQAGQYLDINVGDLGVDLMSVNGSKIYGPKGIGFLYIKSGTKIEPLFYGGGQEKKLRSGTENVPLIVGLAKALEIAREEQKKDTYHNNADRPHCAVL